MRVTRAYSKLSKIFASWTSKTISCWCKIPSFLIAKGPCKTWVKVCAINLITNQPAGLRELTSQATVSLNLSQFTLIFFKLPLFPSIYSNLPQFSSNLPQISSNLPQIISNLPAWWENWHHQTRQLFEVWLWSTSRCWWTTLVDPSLLSLHGILKGRCWYWNVRVLTLSLAQQEDRTIGEQFQSEDWSSQLHHQRLPPQQRILKWDHFITVVY